jgi:S-formylglutathione hydrolase FrmB
MVRRPRILLFLFLFSCSIPLALGQSRIDCSALQSRILKRSVHYCVLLPAGYDSAAKAPQFYPVLYFLHGLGQNEQTLFQSGGWNLIQDLRQQNKIGDFLIVTPQGWASFFINSADGKVRYSDFFLQEFVPYIERKYRVRRQRSARAISGISMGGYGALRFAFAYPEMFSSVSAQSAALITESPQQLDTAMRSGAPLERMLGAVFGQPIDIPHWRRNDPFVLARQNRSGIARLAIYFNCGKADEYGFETGAEALHRQLTAEGIKHEFHLYPGDHSAEYFLSHLGETLQFHWRAFQAGK